MSPISFEDAKKQVNPALDDEQKDQNGMTAADRSALALVAGTAANEAYWDSRGRLEQLEAQAAGHGQIVRGADAEASADELPTGSGTAAATTTASAPDIEPPPATEAAAVPADTGTPDAAPAPTPDNPIEAVAILRQQLQDQGITPEV